MPALFQDVSEHLLVARQSDQNCPTGRLAYSRFRGYYCTDDSGFSRGGRIGLGESFGWHLSSTGGGRQHESESHGELEEEQVGLDQGRKRVSNSYLDVEKLNDELD